MESFYSFFCIIIFHAITYTVIYKYFYNVSIFPVKFITNCHAVNFYGTVFKLWCNLV